MVDSSVIQANSGAQRSKSWAARHYYARRGFRRMRVKHFLLPPPPHQHAVYLAQPYLIDALLLQHIVCPCVDLEDAALILEEKDRRVIRDKAIHVVVARSDPKAESYQPKRCA